ncbi:MAG TPA: hypothetical protein VIC29_11820 [Steroidobacteraceae bacterium]|jgi:hypothetical protein
MAISGRSAPVPILTYGVRLVVLELLSRRLGWTRQHERVQGAIDALIDQNLKGAHFRWQS